jgi:hypothetical protein
MTTRETPAWSPFDRLRVTVEHMTTLATPAWSPFDRLRVTVEQGKAIGDD